MIDDRLMMDGWLMTRMGRENNFINGERENI
jgi:hypothetical protein